MGPMIAPLPATPPDTVTPHSKWGTVLAYGYLLRVPIIVTLIVFVFPLFALFTNAGKPLFQNFFDLDPLSSAYASFATVLVTWALALVTLVILFNASDRFNVKPALTQEQIRNNDHRARRILLAATLFVATPALLGQFIQSFIQRFIPIGWVLEDPVANAFGVLAGAIAGYGVAYASLCVVLRFVPSAIAVAAEIFPAPEWMRKWLTAAHTRRSIFGNNPNSGLRDFLLHTVPRDFTAGFIDTQENTLSGTPNPTRGLPWSGVVMALAFALGTFGVYWLIGWRIVSHPEAATTLHIPAFCYVLLMLLNATWLFGALTYFFDRFRIPLLAIFVVAAFISENATNYSEHLYALTRAPTPAAITPAQVITPRVKDNKRTIIVMTMGGGIQAAAWTVRVLTGLQAESLNYADGGHIRNFADSVALVSSVSGGATGSLFFLDKYNKEAQGFGTRELDKLVETMLQPRLDGVAWALVYRDVPRIVFPYFPSGYPFLWVKSTQEGRFLDRGRMLELSWGESGIDGHLSDWNEGLAAGWRPASIFNATVAETGEPFLLSTTESEHLPNTGSWRSPQPLSFHDFYRGTDIDLVTAARLASGFPYVMPIPRGVVKPGEDLSCDGDNTRYCYHLIDGGYYDNYGIGAAVQWVDQALTALTHDTDQQGTPREILFVQIRSFPDIRLPDLDHPPTPPDDDYNHAKPINRGWPFELYSPIAGLLHVRASGQMLHGREDLEMLRDKWSGSVHMSFATFEFPRSGAPLSFRMNPEQRKHIVDDWDCRFVGKNDPKCAPDHAGRPEVDEVLCFLKGDTSDACKALLNKGPW